MGTAAFLPKDKLAAWLKELAGDHIVLLPQARGDAVVFSPLDPEKAEEMTASAVFTRDATCPPKSAVFPAEQELLRYSRVKDPEDPGKVDVQLEVTMPRHRRLVFGARPCGVRGFLTYDRVYSTDKLTDPYYAARRQNTLFVTMACGESGNTCFCNWVGSGPDDASGSDMLLTPVEGGYLVEPVTERGEALVRNSVLVPGDDRVAEAEAVRAKAREELEKRSPAPDLAASTQSLMDVFDDLEFWQDMSAKCISCGACTYLCPTCYCFNITDEAKGLSGRRIRSWDNCMSFQFTLEASGHNPRPTKAHRLKNRVGHKFSYYPALHGGAIACCGCGRCIKSCPVSVDIREIVLAAIARAATKAEKAAEEAV